MNVKDKTYIFRHISLSDAAGMGPILTTDAFNNHNMLFFLNCNIYEKLVFERKKQGQTRNYLWSTRGCFNVLTPSWSFTALGGQVSIAETSTRVDILSVLSIILQCNRQCLRDQSQL